MAWNKSKYAASSSSSSRYDTPRTSSDPSTHLSKSAITNKKSSTNLGSMVKKLITNSSKPKYPNLVIPVDLIAQDIKRKQSPGPGGFVALHKKLFTTNNTHRGSERKALTEVKSNTRTLAMLLRSERDLLALNKEHQSDIAHLNSMLQHKNNEVEKLKDLCLKQREEIRSLKSAVLFPDTMNMELLEKQGSELKQAKKLIPSLHRQVTSLTAQLQCLAVDLAEVKADKYSAKGCYEAYVDSPKTPRYDQQDAINSLEFSSEDHTAPGSPDDMFSKDFNPCLTPYSKTKSNEFHELVCDSPKINTFSRNKLQFGHDIGFDPYLKKMSKSSDCCQCSKPGSTFSRRGCRSDETKSSFGNQVR